jgi:hypothetical protein
VPLILPPKDGFLLLDRDKFHGSFAADLPAEQAAFMAEGAGSTVVEVAGSHAIYVSQPAAVAALIEQAASAVDPA